MSKTIAVILAGGSGNRFGADKPKQFVAVNGRTILEHSVWAFASHPMVDEVCVVSRVDYIDYVKELLQGIEKVTKIAEGGKERYHSTLAALEIYTDPNDILLFHDAVRPLVDKDTITRCVEYMQKGGDACAAGVPTTDTIWQMADGKISNIPERTTLYNAQTPQCFKQEVIRKAYDIALQDPSFVSSDDCGVVLRYNTEATIQIIMGNTNNIKITYPNDIKIAENILKLR